MTGIIIALPKAEDGRKLKNILVRSGHTVTAGCTTGAQAVGHAEGLDDGIVICACRLPDMMFTELQMQLPAAFELLLLASRHLLEEYAGSGCLSVAMPLQIHELLDTLAMMVHTLERRRRRRRSAPKARSGEELSVLRKAKALLMERNHMTEEEAHRYIQKCSMDSGTNMIETAQMVLSVMQ